MERCAVCCWHILGKESKQIVPPGHGPMAPRMAAVLTILTCCNCGNRDEKVGFI